jgi:hypothetical protein
MTNFKTAVKSVAERSNQKRIGLWHVVDRRIKWEKFLRVLSGVMALVSGASVTALIGATFDTTIVKIFAAAVAFASGVLGLVSSIYYDSKETAQILDIGGQFLRLRERCRVLVVNGTVTEDRGADEHNVANKEYEDYTAASDRFLPVNFTDKFKIQYPTMHWDD